MRIAVLAVERASSTLSHDRAAIFLITSHLRSLPLASFFQETQSHRERETDRKRSGLVFCSCRFGFIRTAARKRVSYSHEALRLSRTGLEWWSAATFASWRGVLNMQRSDKRWIASGHLMAYLALHATTDDALWDGPVSVRLDVQHMCGVVGKLRPRMLFASAVASSIWEGACGDDDCSCS